MAVKKGNTELLEKINGALKTLKDNGTLDEIVAKYIKARVIVPGMEIAHLRQT
ncbi:MAG: transporter substrate-binding domain-containing protein [Acutalibacteraceae bacterium]